MPRTWSLALVRSLLVAARGRRPAAPCVATRTRPPPWPSRAAPRVSVIIPAYRAAATIGRALQSILDQTVPAHEIVVIDDGSPDDLAGAVAPFGAAVTYVRKSNGGVSSARNAGLARVTGDLIAFLDADDHWERHKLEQQLAILDAHPEVAMIGGALYLEEPTTGAREIFELPPRLLDRVLELDGADAFEAATWFWTGTVVVRRDVLGGARFDEGLSTAEDRELWLRIVLRAPVWLASEPLATQVMTPGSLSRSSIDRDCANMLAVVDRYRELLGPAAHARWTADVHRRWSRRLLAAGAPGRALTPALAHLVRAPSPRSLWTVVKSAALGVAGRSSGGSSAPRNGAGAARAPALDVEVIEDVEGFRALEPAWDELHARSATRSVFTTWAWLYTWWEVFGEGRALRIVVARDGGRVVGIAPLQRRIAREAAVPLRRLELLASGEAEADEIRSEYLDFVIERGREREIVAALWQRIAAWADWDDLSLVSVPGESRLRVALRDAAASPHLEMEETARADAVIVPLAATPAEFVAAQSKKMREDLRRHRRMLEQAGPIRLVRAGSLDELRAMFPIFADLHQRLWTSRGEPGCFASDAFTRFHERVSERMFPTGAVHLHVLHADGRPVAARYGFHVGRRLFEYQSGFDPGFLPKASMGTLAAQLCMEDAIGRGMAEYDLGEGVRSYKLRWTHELRPMWQLRIARKNLRTRAFAAVRAGRSRLREVRRVLDTTEPG